MTTLRFPLPRALAALAALGLAVPAHAGPIPVASFEDAADDATGPGRYTPPTDAAFVDGDFDLRRFAVLVDGEEVLFVVTLGAAFRAAPVATPPGATSGAPADGLSLQNVDIYLDTDPAPGAGSSACLPGRRVTFAGGRTWEAAVVLTPQPGLARAVAREALGSAADHVVFAERLTVRGRTITARVPAALLGGLPRPGWGYSVHVSGARRSEASSSGGPGTPLPPDAFTMPVTVAGGPFAFGGAPPGEAHPRVVDVLLPAGADQAQVLGSFDAASGRYASVPFLYGLATEAPTPDAPSVGPQVRSRGAPTSTPTPTPTATSASTLSSTAAHPEPFDSASLPRGYAQDRLRAEGPESRETPTSTSTSASTLSSTAAHPERRAEGPESRETSTLTLTATPTPLAPDPTPSPSVTLSQNLMPRLAPGAAPPPGAPSAAGGAQAALEVVEVTGELVSAKGPVRGLQPMQFGRVVDAQGITVARVMILRVLDQRLLASAIAGKERIVRGQTLLFDGAAGPAAAPTSPLPATAPATAPAPGVPR